MTLRMIYPSNHIKKGEAVLINPDGTMVMSESDFQLLTDMLDMEFGLNVKELNKAPKSNEQRSSNW